MRFAHILLLYTYTQHSMDPQRGLPITYDVDASNDRYEVGDQHPPTDLREDTEVAKTGTSHLASIGLIGLAIRNEIIPQLTYGILGTDVEFLCLWAGFWWA